MLSGNTVYVGSDHAAFALKKRLLLKLRELFPDIVFTDLGCESEQSCDYPEFARSVGEKVANERARGILLCGTGIGMGMAANKVSRVRAAVVWDTTSARLSREHNNSNVLCMGARLLGPAVVVDIATTWLRTPFLGGERHERRLSLIEKMEEVKR